MKDEDIRKVVRILKGEARKWKIPIVGEVANKSRNDPFKILISCILSLRTKDEVTSNATVRLFKLTDNPRKMASLYIKDIEKAIYPVGFYRVKARNIKEISRTLVDKYNSKVPDEIDELLKLKGVGRKTANLVVSIGYDKPGICVDTHVHRIFNRIGYLKTKTPHQTERALRSKLPPKYWKIINELLVIYGQNLCVPVSPHCSICRISRYCDKNGVRTSR